MGTPRQNATLVAHARLAGAAYLLVILLGLASVGLVDDRLRVAGDPLATAQRTLEHEALFRLGLVGSLVLYLGVVVLAWALYVVLRTVHPRLALLALLLRSAEAVLGGATTLLGVVALEALRAGAGPGIVDPTEAQTLAAVLLQARGPALDLVLVFVGVGGAIFCILFFEGRLIPRPLAAWGVATYASMGLLAVTSLLWPDHPAALEALLYGAGTLFEVAMGLWLLIKAVDLGRWQAHAG